MTSLARTRRITMMIAEDPGVNVILRSPFLPKLALVNLLLIEVRTNSYLLCYNLTISYRIAGNLAGINFGEFALSEHLAKKSLVNE